MLAYWSAALGRGLQNFGKVSPLAILMDVCLHHLAFEGIGHKYGLAIDMRHAVALLAQAVDC